MAKKVAMDNNKWMAAGVCNTCIYQPDNQQAYDAAKLIFKVRLHCIVFSGHTIVYVKR